jgi:MFS family permease
MSFRSQYDTGLSNSAHFKRGIVRAAKMLIFSPIVVALSLYMGLCYSYFYLLLTNITPTFEEVYHFKTSLVGLAYLGLGVGYLLGQLATAKLSDRILKSKARGSEMKPEYRLPLAMVGGFSVPVAFFWYGWSAEAKAHWILPIIGPVFLGFGNSLIFVSCVS